MANLDFVFATNSGGSNNQSIGYMVTRDDISLGLSLSL